MNHPLRTDSKTTAFKMSGSIYTLTTLELHTIDTTLMAAQLSEMTRKAPRFFDQTPVILSFDQTTHTTGNIDLQNFRHLLYKHGMILVAIRGGNQKIKKEVSISGIAWLPSSKQSSEAKGGNVVMMNQQEQTQQVSSAPLTAQLPPHKTLFVDQPVRSGQQIYSPGDLVISATVSSGAELLAGGSIHVYGSLRGRALAGVNGDKNARIFCRQFEAELISISGRYKIPSTANASESLWGECVRVSLDAKNLHIQKL